MKFPVSANSKYLRRLKFVYPLCAILSLKYNLKHVIKMLKEFKYMILEGDLVRLRPIKASDAHEAYSLLINEKVLDWLLWDGPESEEELLNTYTQWENEFGEVSDYRFAIECLDNLGIIGCIDLRFPEHKEQADIGYWLGFPFWNKGYMTDALRLACDFGFKHLGIVRTYAPVFRGNIRSRRVLEKNGFSLDGTLRNHLLKSKQWRDVWFMSLLRSDWQDQQEFYKPNREIP